MKLPNHPYLVLPELRSPPCQVSLGLPHEMSLTSVVTIGIVEVCGVELCASANNR
jgi:hypothetical protein